MTEPTFLDRVKELWPDQRGAPARPLDPFDPARAHRPGQGLGYARAALDGECERVMGATVGERNHTLNRAAFSLGQLVAAGELDEQTVAGELTAAARLNGLDDHEIGPTIASGLRGGAAFPRGIPEPPPQVNSTFTTPTGATGSHGSEPFDSPVEPADLSDPAEPTFTDRLRAALIDTAGLDNIPEPDPLIKGVLYLDSLAWLQGKPGNGKSFIALDIAGCVGSGESWQGFGTPTKGTVLYLVAEGLSGMKQRVRAWEAAMGHPMAGVHFLPVAVQAGNDAEWRGFVELVAEIRPALVVVDTQARVTVGMEENAAKDMGLFVHRLEQLRIASRACVLIVHHQGRAGEHMRGSTAMEGAATTIIAVAKEDDVLSLANPKQKDAPEFDPFQLRLVTYGMSAIVTPNDLGGRDLAKRPAVRTMLTLWWERHGSDPVSVAVLVKSGVSAETTFYANKKALEAKGLIAAEGTGRMVRYRLTREPDPL